MRKEGVLVRKEGVLVTSQVPHLLLVNVALHSFSTQMDIGFTYNPTSIKFKHR